ncbi:MAG: sigma-54-dependent Fis family transcriptional regulator [Phycisphaerales bacterium]|nr:MAG: sigma-54-dependent Fis family transcriptional regulator [Phycisphaerales bacterium]
MQSRPTSASAADRLLIVHVNPQRLRHLAELAASAGYQARRVRKPSELDPLLQTAPVYGIVIVGSSPSADGSSIRGGGNDHSAALELVSRIHRRWSDTQILMAVDTSFTRSQCAQLIDAGVRGFIQLSNGTVNRELFRRQLAVARQRFDRNRQPSAADTGGTIFDSTGFVGCSRAMGDVLRRAARAARISDVPVLIYGESGTGKQLLAETIHRLDCKRSKRRLVSVNCAAIAGSLADSALFGHVKGAFTGATESRLGHFRAADGGTILLDEIGELDLSLQPKLLRVLQEGLVLPVGADEEKPVDVRVIAATNRNLEALVEEGRLRLDLFQRLNVIPIDIPPLYQRPEDIPLLVRFFLKRYAGYYPNPITGIDDEVYGWLSRQRFQGNVRELENVIRRVLAFKTEGDRITIADLAPVRHVDADPAQTADAVLAREVVDCARRMMGSGHSTFTELIDECERLLLAQAIERSRHTQTDLARELGLSRRTLYNKRRKHRL